MLVIMQNSVDPHYPKTMRNYNHETTTTEQGV